MGNLDNTHSIEYRSRDTTETASRYSQPSRRVAELDLLASRTQPVSRWAVFNHATENVALELLGKLAMMEPQNMESTTRNRQDPRERIVRSPEVCGGEALFKGTRVTLRTVLASLAEGDNPEQILAAFPSLSPEDIQAAIAYAAASAEEDLPLPAAPPLLRD